MRGSTIPSLSMLNVWYSGIWTVVMHFCSWDWLFGSPESQATDQHVIAGLVAWSSSTACPSFFSVSSSSPLSEMWNSPIYGALWSKSAIICSKYQREIWWDKSCFLYIFLSLWLWQKCFLGNWQTWSIICSVYTIVFKIITSILHWFIFLASS